MFSYYGSKSKIAALYPKPQHRVIVEPFAGSGRYSLLHWENDVFLYDASAQIVAIWQYLLEASEAEIRSLPDVPSKVHIDTFTQLSSVEKDLIGFHLCRGKAKPRKVGHGQNSWASDRERIASNLYKIRHWKVGQRDYCHIQNRRATWFIDPPYQQICTPKNGDRYPQSEIDYDTLRSFVRTRAGQVIVCEGEGADWLPFDLLTTVNANTNSKAVKRNGEFLYHRV